MHFCRYCFLFLPDFCMPNSYDLEFGSRLLVVSIERAWTAVPVPLEKTKRGRCIANK